EILKLCASFSRVIMTDRLISREERDPELVHSGHRCLHPFDPRKGPVDPGCAAPWHDPKSPAMRERLARSIFWIAWSRVALQTISFGSTILVARLLSPADYGLMALTGIWTNIIALLAELGLGAGIVQFRDVDDRELNTCFWIIMAVSALGYGTLYVAAPV